MSAPPGEQPSYTDYIAFGALQWIRVIGRVTSLEAGDPVATWLDRCLNMFDGLAAKESPAWINS